MDDIHCLKWWKGNYTHRYGTYNYTKDNPKEHFFEQVNIDDTYDILSRISYANERKFGSFISVNSFTNGHPKMNHNAIVEFRTFFADIDVEGHEWKNDEKTGIWNLFNARKASRKKVLAVRNSLLMKSITEAQKYISYLYDNGVKTRQVLTAFKGVHVFVDFKPKLLLHTVGSKATQMYFDNMINGQGFAIDPVNFDSSRLCRIPNSYNPKASCIQSGGEVPTFCVPVTAEEIMTIETVSDYDTLCEKPRLVDFGDTVNETIDIEAFKGASELMVKDERKASDAFKARRFGASQLPSKIWRESWKRQSYNYFTIEDILERIKPCAKWAIINNRFSSHRARVFVAVEILHVGIDGLRTPFQLIHNIYKENKDYSFEQTQYQLEHIGRNEYNTWKYEKIKREIKNVDEICKTCPHFKQCHTYRKV